MDEYPALEQAAVILKSSKQKDVARQFLAYLRTPAVLELLQELWLLRRGLHHPLSFDLRVQKGFSATWRNNLLPVVPIGIRVSTSCFRSADQRRRNPAPAWGCASSRANPSLREEQVFGYELLFRDGVENYFRSSDPDAASRSTLDSSILMGLDVLCGKRRAFVNCTRDVLIRDYITLLPSSQVVVEILETVVRR